MVSAITAALKVIPAEFTCYPLIRVTVPMVLLLGITRIRDVALT